MRKIDNKYQTSGDITKTDGTPLPDDEPLFMFRGKDSLLPDLLEHYKQMCFDAGSPEEQVTTLDSSIAAIKDWQANNKDRVKVPD